MKILSFIQENYQLIILALGLTEIVLRSIPTTKNWSIIDNIRNLISTVVPNNKVSGQRFKIK